MRLLFVCTGNVCRSPFAERRAVALLEASGHAWEVLSAGTGALPGRPCPREAVAAARLLGVDLSAHRSRELTPAMVAWADRIYYMSGEHLDVLERFFPGVADGKLASLAGFSPGPVRPVEVPDPFRCEPWAYRSCYTFMDACLRRLVRMLEGEVGRDPVGPGP